MEPVDQSRPTEEALASRAVLHYMLKAALIEIRAAESIHAARRFADVFHHLPMRLLACSTSADYEVEFLHLSERAKRSGLEAYVEQLKVLAIRSCGGPPGAR